MYIVAHGLCNSLHYDIRGSKLQTFMLNLHASTQGCTRAKAYLDILVKMSHPTTALTAVITHVNHATSIRTNTKYDFVFTSV